jgi:hypothetical protein
MEISANAPRILFLTQGDPRNDRGFPGAARALVEALDRADAVHAQANVRGLTDPFRVDPPQWLRTLRRFDRFFLEGHFRVSSWAFARNSNRARSIAHANSGYNACFMFGTHFAPPFDVPTYCSFDVTVAQVVEAGAWVYRRLTRSEIQSLRARQQRIFERCTAIFPWSEYGAHSVEHDYGIPREKIVVLGAGANLSEEPLPHGPYNARNAPRR